MVRVKVSMALCQIFAVLTGALTIPVSATSISVQIILWVIDRSQQ